MTLARQEQLTAASDKLKAHREAGRSMGEASHAEQASRLAGLYEEVDKLAVLENVVCPVLVN